MLVIFLMYDWESLQTLWQLFRPPPTGRKNVLSEDVPAVPELTAGEKES
jgi:hypothetical protein